MDLFFTLSEEIRRHLFHITVEKEEEIRNMIREENEKDHTVNQRNYEKVAREAQKQLPKFILYETIDNPYKRWGRYNKTDLFYLGNWRRSIPDAEIKDEYKNNMSTAYIVAGYGEVGSYATVLYG